MPSKFKIARAPNGAYHFILYGGNGRVLLTGGRFSSKAACLKGIEAVRQHALIDANFERRLSRSGCYMFHLNAAGGVIGTSALYTSIDGRNKGIVAVRRNAVHAVVEDM